MASIFSCFVCGAPEPVEVRDELAGKGERPVLQGQQADYAETIARLEKLYGDVKWDDVTDAHPMIRRASKVSKGIDCKPVVAATNRRHICDSYPEGHGIHEAYRVWRKKLDENGIEVPDDFDYWQHIKFIEARTRKGIVHFDQAIEYLKKHLEWRKTFKPEQITRQMIQKELDSQDIMWHKRDKVGRPVMVLTPARHDYKNATVLNVQQLTVYLMRIWKNHLSRPDADSITVILNAAGLTVFNLKPQDTKQMIGGLQGNFPASLSKFFIVNAPKVLTYTWKVIKPFIEPDTLEKMHFPASDAEMKKVLLEYIDSDNLLPEFGGTSSYNPSFPLDPIETYPELQGRNILEIEDSDAKEWAAGRRPSARSRNNSLRMSMSKKDKKELKRERKRERKMEKAAEKEKKRLEKASQQHSKR